MLRWMLRLSAVFLFSTFFLTSPASAHTHFYVNLGVPGVVIGYGPPDYYPGYYPYVGYYPGYGYPGYAYPGYGYAYGSPAYAYPDYGYAYESPVYAYPRYGYVWNGYRGWHGHRYYGGGGRYVRLHGYAGWRGGGHWRR